LPLINLSTAKAWSNVTSTHIGTPAGSEWNGNGNTTAIIGQSGHSSSAAKLCADYTNTDYGTGTYSDWYLPSRGELNDLWNSLKAVQKALDSDGNSSTHELTKLTHWSSTEDSGSTAWFFSFQNAAINTTAKSGSYYVRAVRAF